MSILLDFLGSTILFLITSKVMLYVQTGVPFDGFKFPSSISVFLIGAYSCAFVYNPPHSDYVADDITVLSL